MNRVYRIHELAAVTGVTAKALRHYEKLDLLKPRRTEGGYRLYGERDLERLDKVVALKSLGIPLKRIGMVLDRPASELPRALHSQRVALEKRQKLLARAIRAVDLAEDTINSGKATGTEALRLIVELTQKENAIDLMRSYYPTDESWKERRRYYEEGPSREWRELYRDVNRSLKEDPASDAAQALADRWLKLSFRAYSGDPDCQTDCNAAWMDREHWPPYMKRRISEFNLEEVHEYIQRAVLCSRKKYFSREGWNKFQEVRRDPARVTPIWQSRVDVFREIDSYLSGSPDSREPQVLAVRWAAHLDTASENDPELKAGLIRQWVDRPNWTATVRWLEESLSMLSGPQFESAADFIDRALANES